MTTIAIEHPGQTGDTDDAQLNASFARQPILNRDGMLCGYEIKVRAPACAAQMAHAAPANSAAPYASAAPDTPTGSDADA